MNRAAIAGVLLVCVFGFAFPMACVIESPVDDAGVIGRDAGRDASVDPDDGGTLTITTLGPYHVAYGESVSITLAATGGATPYVWTEVSRDEGLAWAHLSSWGVITGIPPQPDDPRVLRVRVEEAGGITVEGDVYIDVAPCTDGQKRTCALSGEFDGCHVGEQECVGGAWPTDGGCIGDKSLMSDDPSMCGQNCTHCEADALQCVKGQCACADAGVPCPPGQTCCPAASQEERCSDLLTDVEDCGVCGVRCHVPDNAEAFCTNGACWTACIEPFDRCGRDAGHCDINTDTSSQHCGACDNTCQLGDAAADNQHETGTCVGGVCELACDPNFGNCDQAPANGCEASLLTDSLHCNGCDQPCTLPPGSEVGSVWCSSGNCSYSCDPGRECGGLCVADTNENHCGGCGRVCSAATLYAVDTASCVASSGAFDATCNITCDPGFENCDGDWTNGCEVDLRIDEANCGECGKTCSLIQQCEASACCQQCGTKDCCYSCDFLNDICRD